MSTPNNEIVDGLLKWWNNRFGIVSGSRNANIYKLAAAFNNYGIPQGEALEVCLRYVDTSGPDPLTAREITAAVSSAYRRTEHGVKEWTKGSGQRHYPPPPPRRKLSDAQARAVEDRLVDVFRRQWHTVATPPPIASPITAPPIEHRRPDAEMLVSQWAGRNPAINTLVDVLGLDLSTAKITNLQTTNSTSA
jgi:hypothetical protein